VRLGPLEITYRKAAPLASSLSPISDQRGGWYPLVREWYTGAWQHNEEPLSTPDVLCNPTLYSCITLIAGDVSKMRPRLMQLDAGIWLEIESPAFSPVLRKPNRYQTRVKFFEWWMVSKLVWGNTYALKQRDARGVVVALYVLDPSRVTVLLATDGSVFYELNPDTLSGITTDRVAVPAREIIHDANCPLFHPLIGVSPIFAAGWPALLAKRITSNALSFFANQSTPGGVLAAPGSITKETADRLKATWEANYTGANYGKVAVLGDGLAYTPMEVASAVDAQLIEQLKWTDEQIAKCFHMPPHKVGIGPMPTYNNIEALNQQYYADCLQTPLEALEAVLDEGLELPRGYGVEFDVDDLVRMDTATLMKTSADGVKGSIFKPNEARRRFNLPPVPGGDTVYMQQQDYSLAALDARDRAQAAPTSLAGPTGPSGPGSVPARQADDDATAEDKAIASWRRKDAEIGAAA
jgi:HK97 family phage portal protein